MVNTSGEQISFYDKKMNKELLESLEKHFPQGTHFSIIAILPDGSSTTFHHSQIFQESLGQNKLYSTRALEQIKKRVQYNALEQGSILPPQVGQRGENSKNPQNPRRVTKMRPTHPKSNSTKVKGDEPYHTDDSTETVQRDPKMKKEKIEREPSNAAPLPKKRRRVRDGEQPPKRSSKDKEGDNSPSSLDSNSQTKVEDDDWDDLGDRNDDESEFEYDFVNDYEAIRISDDKKLKEFIADRFWTLQQVHCKTVAKCWIKIIEPKKQAKYPYKGGPTAPWWLPGINYVEPDHLHRTERVPLLLHLAWSFVDKWQELKASTDESPSLPDEKQEILKEIYKAMENRKMYNEEMIYDWQETHFRKSVRKPKPRQKKAVKPKPKGPSQPDIVIKENVEAWQRSVQSADSTREISSTQQGVEIPKDIRAENMTENNKDTPNELSNVAHTLQNSSSSSEGNKTYRTHQISPRKMSVKNANLDASGLTDMAMNINEAHSSASLRELSLSCPQVPSFLPADFPQPTLAEHPTQLNQSSLSWEQRLASMQNIPTQFHQSMDRTLSSGLYPVQQLAGMALGTIDYPISATMNINSTTTAPMHFSTGEQLVSQDYMTHQMPMMEDGTHMMSFIPQTSPFDAESIADGMGIMFSPYHENTMPHRHF